MFPPKKNKQSRDTYPGRDAIRVLILVFDLLKDRASANIEYRPETSTLVVLDDLPNTIKQKNNYLFE